MVERALCQVLAGRDEELAALEDAVIAATHCDGGVALLSGDAGMGKTRLAGELRMRAERLDCVVLRGCCSESQLALPYLPFVEAIGNHLNQTDLRALRRRLGPLVRELAVLFPQLASRPIPLSGRDPDRANVRLYEAVFALLRAVAGQRTLLLVIEDIHWADASTRELLDYTARRLAGSRLLLLVTCRSDELHRQDPILQVLQRWQRAGLLQQVKLNPLGSKEVGQMVSAMLDLPDITPEWERFLHERCRGNPFVLEEMLKEAMERGDVYRTSTGWERKPIVELAIPRSVSDSIIGRVERLGDADIRVLHASAVLGDSFAYPVLLSLTELPGDRVQEALTDCIRHQLLEGDPAKPGHFRFRHSLTRQAVYEDLLLPRRQALHARAAQVLKTQAGIPSIELARHLIAAGRDEDAVPLCLEAAQVAMRRHATREAAELYERCLGHLDGDAARGRVLCRLGEAQQLSDDPEDGVRNLQEGVTLLERCGEALDAARHRLSLGRCLWERDHPDLAAEEFERARTVLETAGPSEDLARAYIRLAGLRAFDQEGSAAQELAETAIDIASRSDAQAARVWAYTYLGVALCEQGRVAEGLTWLDRGHDEATELGLGWIADTALINGINARFLYGRPLEAKSRIERLRSLSVGASREQMLRMFEAMTYRAGGELERAHATASAYLQMCRRHGQMHYEKEARIILAWIHLDMGHVEESRALLPTDVTEREQLAQLWRVRMRLHIAAGEFGDAQRVARGVLAETGWNLPAWLPEQAVEAFIAAGDVDDAATMIERGGPSLHAIEDHALLDRARGRVAIARGDPSGSLTFLLAATADFAARGERLEAWRTQLITARTLGALGDGAAAELLLHQLVHDAQPGRADLLISAAATLTVALGLPPLPDLAPAERIATPADVTATVTPTERMVTVMFADIRDYTAMAAVNAPAELTERIATFHRWTSREVVRHRGIVDKFAGDAVMATFNVSQPTLDHCIEALEAAIALQDRSVLVGLRIGVGIAVGPAIVGQLTPDANVSVLGETTNLAARLQAQADAGEIILSDDAFRRARTWLEERNVIIHHLSLQLKGIPAEVPVHRITVSREPATAQHGDDRPG